MIRFSWTRKVVTRAALVLLLLAVALGALATAEGQETQPTLPREPTEQEIVDFHRSLDVVSDSSERRARLERARRHAPFQLTWGLW